MTDHSHLTLEQNDKICTAVYQNKDLTDTHRTSGFLCNSLGTSTKHHTSNDQHFDQEGNVQKRNITEHLCSFC
jgi:hypothetical protein